MPKWADYLISAVRFEETAATKHISHVQVHKDGLMIPDAFTWTRAEVIKVLDKGYSFRTIMRNGTTEQWSKGFSVRKMRVDDSCYLKITQDDIKVDDIGDLPSF